MKKFNGCVVKNGVIELTKAFAKNAYTPGTAEFRYLTELHKSFPDFSIVQRTAAKNEDKEKHGGLSIARMEFIIKNYVGDEIALAEFLEVISLFPLVLKITRNYVDRKIKNKDIEPVLSYDADIQAQMAAELDKD